jgi:hypothetical protein
LSGLPQGVAQKVTVVNARPVEWEASVPNISRYSMLAAHPETGGHSETARRAIADRTPFNLRHKMRDGG